MQAYKTCRKKHAIGYNLGIRPDRQSDALRIGSAFHAGLDALAIQGLDYACAIVRHAYRIIPPWAEPAEWDAECETVVGLLCGYEWRWREAPITIIATEQSFDLPIVHPETGEVHEMRWRGKIDKIARWGGRLVVIEHKTTGDSIEDPAADYWRRLRIDTQISGYVLAAREMGYDIETVIYDVVRKPSIEPKLIGKGADKRRETPGEFRDRLIADIGTRPDFYLARREIPRLDHDLAEFRQELWDIACEIRTSPPFRNTAACFNPYPCEYRGLCFDGWKIGGEVPHGFAVVENVHQELEDNHVSSTPSAAAPGGTTSAPDAGSVERQKVHPE